MKKLFIFLLFFIPTIGQANVQIQPPQIFITSPASYQVFQRNVSNQATITVTGTYVGSPTTIQYQYQGGAWTTLVASPSGGSYSGSFTGSTGQGTLSVRFSNQTSVTASVNYVGVGLIYVVAGQSNATSRGTNYQTYSSTDGFKASLFGNDYQYKELKDPYDDNTNQVDSVSSETQYKGGSWVLPLATLIMNATHAPVMFVPSSLSGTGSGAWLPGGSGHTDRTTLYGSMSYRAQQAGCTKAVLWWQGESDAGGSVSSATYKANLQAIADALNTDIPGIKLVPALLPKSPGQVSYTDAAVANINTGITNAIGADANIKAGPDFSARVYDDYASVHFILDSDMTTSATSWQAALVAASLE